MNSLLEILPWLIAMAVLIGLSAFFSASEAALFFLRPGDRRRMEAGSAGERTAARLLTKPERLLSAVLFWNLLINVTYFALSSIVALKLERMGHGSFGALMFAMGSLLVIIFFSEMFPKSIAVTRPIALSRLLSIPLSLAVRLLDPILPLLRGTTLLSRRIFWPGFRLEQDMELADLERAIQLSSKDEAIIQQEQTVLNNIVHLADIRVDEWMRPRSQFVVYAPPVSKRDLKGEVPAGGYLLISEPDSEEIEKALRLDNAKDLALKSIDRVARPVVYLPWRSTVADALEKMSTSVCDVVAIVNELGETIGVLTIDDILDTVLSLAPSRSKRILDLNPVSQIDEDRWSVTGMMSLRRLARRFNVEVPPMRSVTVIGVIQEILGRLHEPGDVCQCGPFRFQVLSAPEVDHVLVEVTIDRAAEEPR